MTTFPLARTVGASMCRGSRMKATTRLAHRRPGGGRRLSSPSSSSASSVDDFDAPAISPVNTSLALSVHFRHPSLGMKDYEILSRATAFLLRVDPPEPNDEDGGRTTKVDDDDDDDGARGGGGRRRPPCSPTSGRASTCGTNSCGGRTTSTTRRRDRDVRPTGCPGWSSAPPRSGRMCTSWRAPT
jgi:hypothetical protein